MVVCMLFYFRLEYFYCKDNELRKDACYENQLFDEETKKCSDFRQVFCNDRPVNDKGKDPCKFKPNGVYPNIEGGCVEFFQCSSNRKVKSGECPMGLKFNVLTLRCDWPNNVATPCGSKSSKAASLEVFIGRLDSSMFRFNLDDGKKPLSSNYFQT